MSAPGAEPLPASWAGWARVQVHPGAGVVDRHGDTLLVVPVVPASQHDRVRGLLGLSRRAATTGDVRGAALAALLEPQGETPGFALLLRSAPVLRILVAGPVRLLVDGREPEEAPAPGSTGIAERVLEDGAWQRITVGAADAPDLEAAAALPLDLETGTVPGAAVTLLRLPVPAAAPPPGAEPPASRAETSSTALRPAVPFRSVLLGECAANVAGQRAEGRRRPPLPIPGEPTGGAADVGTRASAGADVLVEGVTCSRGHFTDPDLSTCPSCGAPIPDSAERVRMPRPPLGILVTDGGTIYPVDGDYVIGREAERSPEVLSGRARALPLRDFARSTSRIHATLTVSGWKVQVTDNGSANGTFISRQGAGGPWRPVAPQVPVTLVHGDRLRLGKRQLLFDAWRETVLPQVFR